jgi:hypothetical protein
MSNNNMRSVRWWIIPAAVFGVLIMSSQPSGAQPCPLSMTVSYAPIQQLSIADVDFDHFESRTLLFTLRLMNSGTITDSAQLNITLSVRLFDGSYTSENALTFTSQSFKIPVGGMNITNLDVGRNGRIQKDQYELSDEAKTKVQDVALATGKFPAGKYTFKFELTNTSCGSEPIDPVEIKFEFDNPSRVELRSPGDGEITNEFPMFEFYSDGANIQLTVAEKTADQSRDEAIHRQPPMNTVNLFSQNSFVYAGGRPLEDGKTYVWQVASKILGPGGTNVEISSPIGLFTVSNAAQSTGSEDEILKILKELFSSRYPTIFQEIEHGEWTLNSGGYSLNGSTLSQSELLKLLNDLQQIKNDVDLSLEGE